MACTVPASVPGSSLAACLLSLGPAGSPASSMPAGSGPDSGARAHRSKAQAGHGVQHPVHPPRVRPPPLPPAPGRARAPALRPGQPRDGTRPAGLLQEESGWHLLPEPRRNSCQGSESLPAHGGDAAACPRPSASFLRAQERRTALPAPCWEPAPPRGPGHEGLAESTGDVLQAAGRGQASRKSGRDPLRTCNVPATNAAVPAAKGSGL